MERIPSTLSIDWTGRRFDLHPQRAVVWSDARTLIIADPHFGKAAAFRHHGIPVPSGTTRHDLDRLASLLEYSTARRLIILGDFLHARAGRSDSTMNQITQWRCEHASIEIILVRGNHDLHAGDPPQDWNFRCVDQPFEDAGILFRHEPANSSAGNIRLNDLPTMAGHIHPCAMLRDIDGSAIRVACFIFGRHYAILPAFGSFTGSHPVQPTIGGGERIFAIGPRQVIEVPVLAPAG